MMHKWILIVFLSLIWGSSFILMKRGLVAFNAQQVAGLRLFIAGLAFLPYLIWNVKKIPWKKLKYILVVALAGNGIPAFLFTFAQTKVESGVAGILNSLTAIFTLLVGASFFGVKLTLRKSIGILAGFLGAVFLTIQDVEIFNLSSFNVLSLLIVMATILYALSINVMKTYLQDISPMMITTTAFSMMTLPVGIYLLTMNVEANFAVNTHASLKSLGYICILALVGTSFAVVLFNKLVQMTNAVFASTITYLIPIVALFWGLLDGEPFHWINLAGMGLILTGVGIIRADK